MITGCKLSKEDEANEVDHKIYRSMIGSLLYLTTSILDIIKVVGLVARIQEKPKETHIHVLKEIFRYLK